jgi:restriction system protein
LDRAQRQRFANSFGETYRGSSGVMAAPVCGVIEPELDPRNAQPLFKISGFPIRTDCDRQHAQSAVDVGRRSFPLRIVPRDRDRRCGTCGNLAKIRPIKRIIDMAIPEFQEFMLPLLKLAGDGHVHKIAEARDALATTLSINQVDRAELLPSGAQSRFDNRVTWARTYLTKAGLLNRIGRGAFKITPRGQTVLASPPTRIDKKFLRTFPEFVHFADDWKSSTTDTPSAPASPTADDVADERTPEETLEASYASLRATLATDLLEKLTKTTPKYFEHVVIDLLVAMGYGGSRADAAQVVGKSGDEGIDGIIKEDKLGLDVVYVQAKRWAGPVSRPDVQSFAGSLEGQRARKGVFITTSRFTSDAREFVRLIEKKIVLIDGPQLAELMIDHRIGVSTVATYEVRRVDLDYFEEDE